MTTIILITLCLLWIGAVGWFLAATKKSLAKRQIENESFLEIIPRDVTSHSDRDAMVVPKKRFDVRVSQFIR